MPNILRSYLQHGQGVIKAVVEKLKIDFDAILPILCRLEFLGGTPAFKRFILFRG